MIGLVRYVGKRHGLWLLILTRQSPKKEAMQATSTTDHIFDAATLDGEWADYDEDGGIPVSILNIEYRIEKA